MSNPSAGEKLKEFYKMLLSELKSGQLTLPPFPEIAIRVRNVMEDPNTNIDDIVRVLKIEPTLSARILQIANTAAMGGGADKPIIDLPSAISRIGLKVVRNTAITLAMQQIYQNSSSSDFIKENLDILWRHSVDVASISFVLAKKYTNLNPDEALLAGLLHDIGKLLILDRAEQYPDVFYDSSITAKLLNKLSPEISSSIVKSWGLGDELSNVAKDHTKLNRNPGEKPDLTDIVLISNMIGMHKESVINAPINFNEVSLVLNRLSISPDQFTDVVDDIIMDARILSLSLLE